MNARTAPAAHIVPNVQRPYVVKIKAQDASGQPVNKRLEGWEARVFLHEFDHLDGVLFPDRMPRDQLQREQETLQKLEAAFEKQNPGVDYESVLAPSKTQLLAA